MNKEIADALREVSNKIDEYGIDDTATPSEILDYVSTSLWQVAEELDPKTEEE